MKIIKQVKTLWAYMQLNQPVTPADLIIVFGSNDIRVAEYAASLYLQGFAPRIVFSGGLGRFTESLFTKSEAEIFSDIALDMGVKKEHIFIENQSTNTGENIINSARVVTEKQLNAQRILLIQKPYMERRALASFEKQWPLNYQTVTVTSAGGSFFDYINDELSSDFVVQALIADFQRIQEYPKQGFQTEQPIPLEVTAAYQFLKNKFPTI
jgi:uncharacterized SAM-binding protein YcdF (DUF218 family)